MHVEIHFSRLQVWCLSSSLCKMCLTASLINVPSFMEAVWVWSDLFLWSSWDLQQGPGACQLPCIGITPLKSVQTSWGFWTHKCNYCYNESIKQVIIIFTLSFHFKMRKLFPLGSVKVIYIMHNNGLTWKYNYYSFVWHHLGTRSFTDTCEERSLSWRVYRLNSKLELLAANQSHKWNFSVLSSGTCSAQAFHKPCFSDSCSKFLWLALYSLGVG